MPQPRVYEAILREQFATLRQMAFVAGPRQVGKTTVARQVANAYFNWDNADHRRVILAGPKAVAEEAGLTRLRADVPVIAFDEIHRHGKWKAFLKGFFDTYSEQCRVVVTGSSRLDVFRRGGDSLMGRYFLHHMHPLSVGELLEPVVPVQPVRSPRRIDDDAWASLQLHGGYPEPWLRADSRFTTRWRRIRLQQLLREDVRDLTRVQELAQLETLGLLLTERSGQQIVLSNLAADVGTSVDTVRRWLSVLTGLHHGFLVRPWTRNVTRSLRKEPRWYLRDWSGVEDEGARAETLVACHLLKAVEMWTDLGLGQFDLFYLRDKEKREVDFVVIRNRKPWFLVDVKASDERLSPWLEHFQQQTRAEHAFQVVLGLPFVDADCFSRRAPTVIPARTFLSQLP
ncbi:MAG: AAA family ATPase [Myxococcota bacterium]